MTRKERAAFNALERDLILAKTEAKSILSNYNKALNDIQVLRSQRLDRQKVIDALGAMMVSNAKLGEAAAKIISPQVY